MKKAEKLKLVKQLNLGQNLTRNILLELFEKNWIA